MQIDCDIAPAHSGDPVFLDQQQCGTITSAGYGHRVNQNIAFAYIEPEVAVPGQKLQIGILGERYDAEVTPRCLYDPENKLVKS